MQYTSQEIALELETATQETLRSEERLYAADAVAEAVSMPGLRYVPLTPARDAYVVACDGQVIGKMWPDEERHLLQGWTVAALGTSQRLGPYRTARAAAAGLAKALSVTD